MKQRRSFKPVTCHRRQQAGDALLDALIAMLLAMVIGLGPVYVASRGAVAQRQASYQNMAVVEMRKLLAAQGPASLCGTTPQITVKTTDAATTILNLPVTVTCTTRPASGITIGGQAVDPTSSGSAQTVSLSVSSSTNDDDDNSTGSKAKFGGGGIITITQGGT